MVTIKIEIVSDTVCPWCYLGHRRLQKAIRLYQKTYPEGSEDEFKLIWKPYILDPDPPAETVSVHDRMVKKMTPDRVAQVQKHLVRLGTGEGIAFKFGGRVASPLPSRQLLYLAGLKGSVVQTRVAEELFRVLWECEEDLSRVETLVDVGAVCGLDGGEVRKALEEGMGIEEVQREQRDAKENRINGVPHYIVGGEIHLTGAVDWDAFFEALVKVKEDKQ